MSTSDQPDRDSIRIQLLLADPDLAQRLALLLSNVHGLMVVEDGADALLIEPPPHPSVEGPGDDLLTAREREVLGLLAEGASNKLIARRLGISVHTAKFHVRSLTDKLDATGRTDAVTHAARLGVIHL